MQNSTPGYRIEKTRCRVTVTTLSGESLDGDIFLQPFAGRHPGPETPLDILCGDAFFPLLLPGGDTRLVATARIADVRWPGESTDAERAALARSTTIEVRLVTGAIYRGTILIEAPERHGRMLDFLNFHSDRFLTLSSNGENLSINREMVESVRPLE